MIRYIIMFILSFLAGYIAGRLMRLGEESIKRRRNDRKKKTLLS